MADSSAQAVSTLHDALSAFRKACGSDADCEKIVTLCDATERQIELDYPAEEKREKPGTPDEPEEQPTDLKSASAETRKRFQADRKKAAA